MRTDEVLTLLNEWWMTGSVKRSLAPDYKRYGFFETLETLNKRQITILTGLRRVGKTTIFFQTIDYLIKSGLDPKRIVYFSFDEKIDDLKTILDEYQKITGVSWKEEKVYVFLDEIHKLQGWGRKVKMFYDNFPNLKILLSGSSSVELEREAYKNLVGRFFLINLKPLYLKEFIELKKGKAVEGFEVWRDELFLNLNEYFKKPFPEIVDEEDERRIQEYIRENIIGKMIHVDLPKKFKNVNEELLLTLLEIFYQNPGMILNITTLSKSLRISKKTLIQHIFFLKFSYLIRIVKNFRVSILATSRKMPKVYPYHWSLSFGLFRKMEEGKLLESAVASILDAKYYWRKGNKEVDFLLKNEKIVPVEVKTKEDLGNLQYFLRRFGIDEGFVVFNQRRGKEVKLDKLKVKFIPFIELAFYPDSVKRLFG
ncbi:MAG: ATP-binding protein [Candidatus Aenigmarchaeota archaeon]|nr:ATP-binding protein [Candidatus Aenigmarchaeota archaeon]